MTKKAPKENQPKGLDYLEAHQDEYDEASKDIMRSLRVSEKEIGEINAMKGTAGWRILNKKIREELTARISELVKDDLKVQTLLALLNVADTKALGKLLNDAIAEILPDG